MPQRALFKLKRAGIAVYDVQKPTKTRLECSVSARDGERALALYSGASSFTVTELPPERGARFVERCKRRVGVGLGILLFCISSLQAERFVFAVDIVGSQAYNKEVYQALDENGIAPFRIYRKSGEREAYKTLLALPGVEFCSVQKVGLRVRVEMRLYDLPQPLPQTGNCYAAYDGTVLSVTVLKGTAAVKIGQRVHVGDVLVYGWFFVEDKGQVSVEPIAHVRIGCVYEAMVDAATDEEAFAIGYLALGLRERDCVTAVQVREEAIGRFVRIEYTVTQSVNL